VEFLAMVMTFFQYSSSPITYDFEEDIQTDITVKSIGS